MESGLLSVKRIFIQLRMEKKMATVDKALELLEQLRMVAWDVTIQGIYFKMHILSLILSDPLKYGLNPVCLQIFFKKIFRS